MGEVGKFGLAGRVVYLVEEPAVERLRRWKGLVVMADLKDFVGDGVRRWRARGLSFSLPKDSGREGVRCGVEGGGDCCLLILRAEGLRGEVMKAPGRYAGPSLDPLLPPSSLGVRSSSGSSISMGSSTRERPLLYSRSVPVPSVVVYALSLKPERIMLLRGLSAGAFPVRGPMVP